MATLYFSEPSTVAAATWMRKHSPKVIVSEFGRIEVFNSFYQRRFRKQLDLPTANRLVQALEQDFESKVLQLRPAPESVFSRSLTLTTAWTPKIGTRASDIIHVATALELKVDIFLSFDKRQQELARLEGLKTL